MARDEEGPVGGSAYVGRARSLVRTQVGAYAVVKLVVEAMFAVVKPSWTVGGFSRSGRWIDEARCGEGPRTVRKWSGSGWWVVGIWWATSRGRNQEAAMFNCLVIMVWFLCTEVDAKGIENRGG